MEEIGAQKHCAPMTKHSNKSEYAIRSMAIGNKYVATGTSINTVNIWRGKQVGWKRKKKLEVHGATTADVKALAIDGQYLYSGSESGFIEIWDEKDKFKKVGEIGEYSSPITGICFDDDAIFVTTETDFSVVKKDEREIQLMDEYDLANHPRALTITPKYICYSVDAYIPVYSWIPATSALEKLFVLDNSGGMTFDLHIQEKMLYSAGWNGQIRIWDLEAAESSLKPQEILNPMLGALESVYADDAHIYVGSHFGILCAFDRNKLTKVDSWDTKELEGKSSAIRKIFATPDYAK